MVSPAQTGCSALSEAGNPLDNAGWPTLSLESLDKSPRLDCVKDTLHIQYEHGCFQARVHLLQIMNQYCS